MYADKVTKSMKAAIDETTRRRAIQEQYNKDHGITPEGIKKAIAESMQEDKTAELADMKEFDLHNIPRDELKHLIKQLKEQMEIASANLQFEKAAGLRDQIAEVRDYAAGQKIRKK